MSKKIGLEIKQLSLKIANKTLLKDISLKLPLGQISVLMGPNGSGKSSLAKCIIGLTDYDKYRGKIFWQNKNLSKLSIDQRSRLRIFLAWQNPPEIPGLMVRNYLMTIYNASGQKDQAKFEQLIKTSLTKLGLAETFLNRELNEGFSGGEKKKMEILQMLVLDPQLIIFDEIDSGLDLDALKNILQIIKKLSSPKRSFILITHNPKILKHLVPDQVIVLCRGQIASIGKKDLIKKIEKYGFTKILK